MPLSDKTNPVKTMSASTKFEVCAASSLTNYSASKCRRPHWPTPRSKSQTTHICPREGMVRYAVSPWDPLGNNFSGLVVYTGNAWAAV